MQILNLELTLPEASLYSNPEITTSARRTHAKGKQVVPVKLEDRVQNDARPDLTRLKRGELKHGVLGSRFIKPAVPRSPHTHLRMIRMIILAGPPLMHGPPAEARTKLEQTDWRVERIRQTQCSALWPVHATQEVSLPHHLKVMQEKAWNEC